MNEQLLKAKHRNNIDKLILYLLVIYLDFDLVSLLKLAFCHVDFIIPRVTRKCGEMSFDIESWI